MATRGEPDPLDAIRERVKNAADAFEQANQLWRVSSSARTVIVHLLRDARDDPWLRRNLDRMRGGYFADPEFNWPGYHLGDGDPPLEDLIEPLLRFIQTKLLTDGDVMALNTRIGALQIAQYLTPFMTTALRCGCWPRGT